MKEQITILAASNNPDCLDNIGLYMIMLAKRTGMKGCLLFVYQQDANQDLSNLEQTENRIQEKTLKIQHAGANANVRIDCLVTKGNFVEEVAKYIQIFDSPILVVGDGASKIMREKELRMVEKILESKAEFGKSRPHHFLVISGKDKIGSPAAESSLIDSINPHYFCMEC